MVLSTTPCSDGGAQVSSKPMKGTPWQIRMQRAGLDQKDLAALCGVTTGNMSKSMSGKRKGVPGYAKTIIRIWERASLEDRLALLDAVGNDDA